MKPGEYDNFALDCFRRCPTYYRRRIVQSLIKPTDNKLALEFGIASHLGLEKYYEGGMTDEARATALSEFMLSFAPHESIADDKRTVGRGLDILTKYFMRYREEPFEVIATEVGVAFPLDDTHIYVGRLDLVVKWLSPIGIYGVDHKTSSDLDSLVDKPNNQITGYIYYLHELYENVHGFIINGLGVYKTDKKKDKASGKMVERDIFRRIPTTRSPYDLEHWRKGVLHTIHQIEECCAVGVWPMYDQCKKYRSWCPYRDLCNCGSEEMAMKMVESGLYVVEPWSAYEEEGGIEG